MRKPTLYLYAGVVSAGLLLSACASLRSTPRQENKNVPAAFAGNTTDTTNGATMNWRSYFTDKNLAELIDTALKNNQELNITIQEIEISRNEIRARKGEYLPFVSAQGAAGLEKVGRYTRNGAVEATTDIKPGQEFPEPLTDFMFGAVARWEVDIWSKLHNAKRAAVSRYLGTVEGKNFMVTNLIAEIANSYYELLALDNQLSILQQNIDIQT
ncbi:MAG: TolC family protein, partial [Bacteroidota bacterium]